MISGDEMNPGLQLPVLVLQLASLDAACSNVGYAAHSTHGEGRYLVVRERRFAGSSCYSNDLQDRPGQ